jgi:hypothetical protein
MGIMYKPVLEGELDGTEKGLHHEISLFEYADRLPLEEMDGGYWVGFVTGYSIGQQARGLLKNAIVKLSFDERMACYELLLYKRRGCGCGCGFEIPATYLKEIQYWADLGIPWEVCQNTRMLLENGQIQRAIAEIAEHCRISFAVFGYLCLGKFSERLQAVRKQRRNSKDYDTAPERAAIEADLRAWLLQYGEESKV